MSFGSFQIFPIFNNLKHVFSNSETAQNLCLGGKYSVYAGHI